MSITTKPVVLNVMDSSLVDLERKGVLQSVCRLYNPQGAWQRVLHFTPHERDLQLRGFLEPYGIEVYSHGVEGLSPLKALRTTYRFWKILKSEKVDIVRGRLPYLGSLMAGIASRLRGVPFVVSLGGDNRIVQEKNKQYNYNNRFLSYGIEWLVLKLANSIIVPNIYTARYVSKIIGSRNAETKCVRIPWLSDPVTKKSAYESKWGEHKQIVIVGFLNKYKFTDVIFDALKLLFSQNQMDVKGWNIVFCGDGPLKEAGEELFKDCSQVKFVGWTQREKVHDYLNSAGIVLVPMSGFVLLEAASLGKVVVTSDVEWHREMICDGDTGRVVVATDPQAWCDAIVDLICNFDRATKMGAKLKVLYDQDYSPKASIAAEVELYGRLTSWGQK
ncbi:MULTISPECIES: glycosyltransferase family 4 protein [unclassified Thalassospira]|uniref:glycosyltransferase family 4 protein n=1 Tax=unclassified Thalassospira TaxID=2648997 RepID=UPI001B19AF08|nr:glycosyltransferase family 4 protein [Thalassospira sp.]MBO6769745.1 glycosyltransferase family 4 protein [Thalassospira sp.]